MDLQKHYESYRTSVKKDALEGFAEYAKKTVTADPGSYPTIFDYLTSATKNLVADSQSGDVASYKSWLLGHQQAATGLFMRMASDEIKRLNIEEKITGPPLQLKLIDKGWNWFKFGGFPMDMNVMIWIPRYGLSHVKPSDSKPFYDADEMKLILDVKPEEKIMKRITQIKQDTIRIPAKLTGFSAEGAPQFWGVDKINEGQVRDWTQPLFQ